jgi:hypothetical protein
MTMLFLRPNEFNTVTQVVVDLVNTGTTDRVLDKNRRTYWETVGYGSITSTIFSIEFSTATSIDSIFLQGINVKQYRIFYNSVTANTFTPAIAETTNSETSKFYQFNTTTVNSIQVQIDRAFTSDTEKRIGEIYIGSLMLNFERNPDHASYKPVATREQKIHRMPNGGVSQFLVDQKFKASIDWKFVTDSFTTQLLSIYETGTTMYFIPFPTTTAWDGNAYHCAWTNDFDFRHSSNNPSAGQGGKIVIEETA